MSLLAYTENDRRIAGASASEQKARHRAFQEKIAAAAAKLEASRSPAPIARPAPAAKADPLLKAIAPAAMPAEPPPPKRKHWFWIVDASPRAITIMHVMDAVCDEFNVKPADLAGPRRTANLVVPRQVSMWLAKELCPHLSYPAIGRRFGGRDHTTVMHAYKIVPVRLANNPDLAARVEKIRNALIEDAAPIPPIEAPAEQ